MSAFGTWCLFATLFATDGASAADGAAVAVVEAEAPRTTPVSVDARIDATQLVAADSFTDRRLVYTDLRGVVYSELGTSTPLRLQADVLGRIGHNDVSPSRYDISRLYLELGDPAKWTLAVGRVNLDNVNATQVDGARFSLGLGERSSVSVFGGLMPHPILRTFDPDFVNTGAAYDVVSKDVNHGGGVSVQLYQGELDRAFVTERVFVRVGPAFSFYGRAVVDFLTPNGILGDLSGVASEDQSTLQKIDVSQAFATVRLKPAAMVDFAVSGSHMHALLPASWWTDWVEQERLRRGFTLDGPLPVGSRRSTGRVVMNLHFGALNPYVSARYDRRHEDDANGYEGRVGVKYANRGLGYVDAHALHREYFGTQHQLVGGQIGIDIVDGLTFDAGGSALRVTAPGEDPGMWLFDANGTLWWELGSVFEPLRRAHVLAMYQAFVEPEIVYQVFVMRIGYRLDERW